MESLPNCPKCNSEYTYEDGTLLVCPECSHEWFLELGTEEDSNIIKDINGNRLNDGDSVTVVRDLKVKGSSSSIKIGTKVKNIRLIQDLSDGHDIECKIDGFGAMKLKSSVVKKAENHK
ncbi:alkylphosphonate utilization protein [Clostridioides sp. ES-S-0108-01]|uniref:zinc ribbon domain-containing protein YjdM n=1 Tax=Clostridioides sp. ES-S-0108-01 TaxID=2770773 RepID=UPI001D0CA2BF|nr:alkylphosphonate utilization protein [Clostridioides sp. ES-S-0108-01]UDN51157.1 alkylphosphonate utilization protein [Clostridioides sp. ES-S-0107-01]